MKRTMHVAAALLSGAALSATAIGLVARWTPVTGTPILIASAGAPYLMSGAIVGLIVAVVAAQRATAIVALVATAVVVALHFPRFSPDSALTDFPNPVRIQALSVNLNDGLADADAVAQLARGHADVVAVARSTPAAVARLDAAGIDATFPYSLHPVTGAGPALWSRVPIVAVPVPEQPYICVVAGRLRVPGLAEQPIVASVDVTAPYPHSIDAWRRGIAAARDVLRDLADRSDGAVIAAGGFQSTQDMIEFRRLGELGFGSATDQAGAGIAMTFPTGRWYPPLLAIDHVLIREGRAVSASTVAVPGTPHRSLLTTVELPHRSPR